MIIESTEDMTGREAEIALRAYTGHTDRSTGRSVELTLRSIVQMNAETVADTKGELPMWGGVLLDRAKDGDKVAKIPVSFTAVMGDHDAGTISVKAAGAMLEAAGVTGAIVETASSTPESPRWRAIVPTSGPLPADQHLEQVSKLNTALEGSLAPESWSSKQGYYYGHLRGTRTPESVMVLGAPIDLLKIRGTPCILAPNRSLGDSPASARSLAHEFDQVGLDGGEIPGTERPSHEKVATTALKTGENLHAGILAATYLVATGKWPEQFTLDAFIVAANATRGANRAAGIPHEWNKALTGAMVYLKEKAVETKSKEPSKLLVPFKLAATITSAPTSIRGYLPSDGIGIIWGAPSSFKSFFSLDMAMSIATGVEWHGRPVKRGVVWYLAGEGQSGTERRVRAWMQEHGQTQEAVDGHLFYTPKSLLINEASGEPSAYVHALLEEIKRGNVPTHIFVDTIARTMSGDENTSKDMGAYIRALEVLVDAIRDLGQVVCVSLVHHSRKEGDAYRGSSALRGAADFEFEVGRDNMAMSVECRKMKDFAEPGPQAFKAVELPLGETTDEWDIVTTVFSLVLRLDDSTVADQMAEKFAPIRVAILDGHGTSRTALKNALGIKGNRSMDMFIQPFLDAEWLVVDETAAGSAKPYKIGPKAPVDM